MQIRSLATGPHSLTTTDIIRLNTVIHRPICFFFFIIIIIIIIIILQIKITWYIYSNGEHIFVTAIVLFNYYVIISVPECYECLNKLAP